MQKKKENHFLIVYPKLFFLIPVLLLCFLQPVYGAQMLIPSGHVVGITMDTKGLLVLGTGSVEGENNQIVSPCKGILQEGDLLLEVEGQKAENKEFFMAQVEQSGGEELSLRIRREGKEREVSVTPAFSVTDDAYRIGAWIRDSIQGIGTVTYYDPEKGAFGALGHGVYDVDTDRLLEIRSGGLVPVELTGVVRAQKGEAGELTGEIDRKDRFAKVEKNTEKGIFGVADAEIFAGNPLPIACSAEVREGRAYILSDFEDGSVKRYAVEIERISPKNGNWQRDLRIRIIDEHLINLTGGIVQGISGSPIIQNDKLVGAVTHVLVNEPTKGYGVFIENMLEAAG